MQQNIQYFVSSILLYLHSNNEFLTFQKKSYSKFEISGCNGQPENGVSGPSTPSIICHVSLSMWKLTPVKAKHSILSINLDITYKY